MFVRRDARHGPAYDVDIAFTDRWGGASTGLRATLDLSRPLADAGSADHVNWSRLHSALGVDRLVGMRQVHGADVVLVSSSEASGLAASPPRCDALVTSAAEVALCVRAADCVPVLLADVARGVVGAAHAGRRGIAAGVLLATVAVMRAQGGDRIEAWLGPHVCGRCYEVPAAMRAEVAMVTPAAFSTTATGSAALDLGAAATDQLVASGCSVVESATLCTMESDDLFSYRRQGPDGGRLAGIVVLHPAGTRRDLS